MLRRLHLKNCFTHRDATFEFDRGMTAIIGPNEAGKSLIIEMIRYALFGSEALRGSVNDYKKLVVELDFEVRGQSYQVVRSNGKAALLRGDDIIASGVKTVNAKIQEILGYGIKVFDTANAANQGEIEALGKMRPTERKRMVDSVIGLTVLDDLAEWAGGEATALEREARAQGESLTAPLEPTKPEDYAPSETLKPRYKELKALQREKDQIVGWLRNEPAQPVQPSTTVQETAEELRKLVDARQAVVNSRAAVLAQFKGLRKPPTMTLEEIEQAEERLKAFAIYQEAVRFFQTYVAPTLSREECQEGIRQHELYHRWKQKQDLLKKGHHECPACHHRWPAAADALAAYEDVPEVVEAPAHPLKVYHEQLALNDAWDKVADQRVKYQLIWEKRVEDPKIDQKTLNDQRAAHADEPRRQEITAKLLELDDQLAALPDRSDDLKARLQYEAELAAYQTMLETFNKWQKEAEVKRARLAELQHVDEELQAIEKRLMAALQYESELKTYQTAAQRYAEAKAAIEAKLAEAEEWRKAKRALQLLKTKVKQHLIPSLNRVASLLLTQMTGGKRRDIFIDDEFDVLVDGQPLNTLSGSTKAVANLAIRIGLGQVLTNKVFSVFMADEIDAAMDNERAGFTAECLRNLTKQIAQIILVSHKRPDADHYIELGKAA